MNEKQELMQLASDIAYIYNWIGGECETWAQNVLEGDLAHCCRCMVEDHQYGILFGG